MSNSIRLTLPPLAEGQASYEVYADVPGSRHIHGDTWYAYDWLPRLVATYPVELFQKRETLEEAAQYFKGQ